MSAYTRSMIAVAAGLFCLAFYALANLPEIPQ